MQCYQLLKVFDEDWKEYQKLKYYVRSQQRKLMNDELGERATYNFYINQDKLKQLKKRLIKKGLIKAPKKCEVQNITDSYCQK